MTNEKKPVMPDEIAPCVEARRAASAVYAEAQIKRATAQVALREAQLAEAEAKRALMKAIAEQNRIIDGEPIDTALPVEEGPSWNRNRQI